MTRISQMNLLDADDIDQAALARYRTVRTLMDMAKHARHSADMHLAHGEIEEASRWSELAARWEARCTSM